MSCWVMAMVPPQPRGTIAMTQLEAPSPTADARNQARPMHAPSRARHATKLARAYARRDSAPRIALRSAPPRRSGRWRGVRPARATTSPPALSPILVPSPKTHPPCEFCSPSPRPSPNTRSNPTNPERSFAPPARPGDENQSGLKPDDTRRLCSVAWSGRRGTEARRDGTGRER